MLAAIVMIPDGAMDAANLQKQAVAVPRLIAKLEAARTPATGGITIEHKPFNFAAKSGDTFGDIE
jgi:hypothetical protein